MLLTFNVPASLKKSGVGWGTSNDRCIFNGCGSFSVLFIPLSNSPQISIKAMCGSSCLCESCILTKHPSTVEIAGRSLQKEKRNPEKNTT
jgi:hypothetical protein